MKIDRITFTGADDTVADIDRMFSISVEHPFVEWGILFSEKYTYGGGTTRFPSMNWLERFWPLYERETWVKSCPIKLAAHVCGSWVREILKTGTSSFFNIDRVKHFPRVQLNFHAEKNIVNEEHLIEGLKALSTDITWAHQFIFQMDGVNDKLMNKCRSEGVNVCPLFDLSGGTGVVPDEWPKPFEGVYCGYAGGLGPHNIEVVLADIEKVVGDRTIWIDMETWIRDKNDDFDLSMCEDVIQKTLKYIK